MIFDLRTIILLNYNVCPIKYRNCQYEYNYLSYLHSDVKFEMILYYFFFIHKKLSLLNLRIIIGTITRSFLFIRYIKKLELEIFIIYCCLITFIRLLLILEPLHSRLWRAIFLKISFELSLLIVIIVLILLWFCSAIFIPFIVWLCCFEFIII